MAQQTAVEWLITLHQQTNKIDMFDLEVAKEMEKVQIKEGYIMSLLDSDNKIRRDAEDYYNETYNK